MTQLARASAKRPIAPTSHGTIVRVTRTPLRILGIDPGLNRTGWGVIEADGQTLRAIACGVIRIPAGDLAPRLAVILRELAAVIGTHAPRLAVVEKVFVNTNPQSTLLLGQARGAALCAAVQAGLDVHEYSALQVSRRWSAPAAPRRRRCR